MQQFLVREKLSNQQRRGRRAVVAHHWDGSDTLCRMWSTGGLKKTSYRVAGSLEGAQLCRICKEETALRVRGAGEEGAGPLEREAFRLALERDDAQEERRGLGMPLQSGRLGEAAAGWTHLGGGLLQNVDDVDQARAILVHFDGACWPNPGGILGWGATITRGKETLHEIAGGLPAAHLNTNNVAEYLALTAALEWLLEQGHGQARVHIRGDSRLVLRQMFPNAKGKRWKLKDGSYLEYARAAWMLLGRFTAITGEWVPREGNRRADALSQQGVREVAG